MGVGTFARTVTYEIMNLYTVKMAGVFMVFPLWVFLISIYILIDNLGRSA